MIQPINQDGASAATASANAGALVLGHYQQPDTTKHSCKGKNDCKGQGGGKERRQKRV